MNPRQWIALSTCILLSPELRAQNISATLTALEHPDFAGIATQFQLTGLEVNGSSFYGGSAYIICSDFPGITLDEDSATYPRPITNLTVGSMDDMEVWNRWNDPQDEALAKAMIYWLVDNYYQSHFLDTGPDQDTRQYAFGNVVWEIFGDGATANGFDFSTGNIDRSKFSPSGTNPRPALWAEMNSLLGAVGTAVGNGTITASYSRTFNVLAALDPRTDHQDYLLLAENPALMLVPEPSSAMLAMLGALAFFRRRR